MELELDTTLQEPKDILAWNLFTNSSVDRIGSPGLGLFTKMTIHKASTMEQGCGQGTDSVVLRRRHNAPIGWQAWYWFPAGDFWDFWGGWPTSPSDGLPITTPEEGGPTNSRHPATRLCSSPTAP